MWSSLLGKRVPTKTDRNGYARLTPLVAALAFCIRYFNDYVKRSYQLLETHLKAGLLVYVPVCYPARVPQPVLPYCPNELYEAARQASLLQTDITMNRSAPTLRGGSSPIIHKWRV